MYVRVCVCVWGGGGGRGSKLFMLPKISTKLVNKIKQLREIYKGDNCPKCLCFLKIAAESVN